MTATIRKLPKFGNAPVYTYRAERLVPFSPDWSQDEPYEAMPGNGHAVLMMDALTGKGLGLFAWEDYQAPARMDWADVSRRFFAHAAKERVSSSEAHVLMWLFGEIGFGSAAVVRQRDAAESLGMSPKSVSKALALLVERGALVRIDVNINRGAATLRAFRLNANYGAVAGEKLGKPASMREEHAEIDRLVDSA